MNGWLAVVALTAMARDLGATFPQYAAAVLVALGITAGAVAYEDRARKEEAHEAR